MSENLSENLSGNSSQLRPVVVVGDGWAALSSVGFLVTQGIDVCWIRGSATKMTAPLAGMKWGEALDVCAELGKRLGIELGERQEGSLIREFRNKAFRQPPWMKGPDSPAREEVKKEVLWAPESQIACVLSARFSLSLAEIEERFRDVLCRPGISNLSHIEDVPLSGINRVDSDHWEVHLADGQSISCSQIIYADRWSLLRNLEGMPKYLKWSQRRAPMGALQAVFDHIVPVAVGVSESFYASIHKESGETVDRNLWGYFSSDGKRSFWTLCLTEEEFENNHDIAKKFRRLKQTLDRIFTEDPFLPKLDVPQKFTSNIASEQVRLVEDALFSAGDPVEAPIEMDSLPGVVFLTDGYGPSAALQQVGTLLEISCQSTTPQTSQTEGQDTVTGLGQDTVTGLGQDILTGLEEGISSESTTIEENTQNL